MAEKLDPEAKRLRNVSSGELADAIGALEARVEVLKAEAIRRDVRRAEGEAYRIVLTPPGTGQRTDKPLLLQVLGITAAEYTARFCHPVHFGEGERTLRRVRYREPPEGVFLGSGTGQKCVSSLPANGRKAEAPPPAVEPRRCDGCDADFRPARPWSRFCCPACRLRAHRRLAV